MWVKICANTSLEDASCAAELGADAVGFVFAPSTRQVTPSQVAGISPHLPSGLERVGVFPAWDARQIVDAAQQAGLTAVQLHGGLDESLLAQLAARLGGGIRIIQTLHWNVSTEGSAEQLSAQLDRVAAIGIPDRVLIDSKLGSVSGGTGVPFDWSSARTVFAGAPKSLRLIVAGGLRPENVHDAIAQLSPWGVDVASGVEASPGRKDRAQVARFIESARRTQTP